MKNLMLFVLVSLAAFGCKKEEQPTALEITVLDSSSNPQPNATVFLFDNPNFQTDPAAAPIDEKTTSNLGKVLFDSGIKSQKYYWLITANCASNLRSVFTTVEPLTANVTNQVNTQLGDEGTLFLQSNSDNPYKVEVNGQFLTNIEGNGFWISLNWPVGTYSIKVTQLSGYILSPTIKTYNKSVSKCGAVEVNFPN